MMKSLQKVTSELVNLTVDDREPLHLTGQIQPHGVLLALKASDLTITQVSENTQAYFRLAPAALLGRPLTHILTEATVQGSPAAATLPTSIAKTTRILIVEDSSLNQMVAMKMLQRLGYQADVVTNGQEALDRFAVQTYDIVLMDCQMPVMDGYAATQQLRQRYQQHQPIIIGVTAYAMVGDQEKCLAAGMNAYLSKPIRMNELNVLLERWAHSTSTPAAQS